MEIKNRKLFKELIKKLTLELLDEESLEEITVTGNVAGYNTPFAFTGGGPKREKKKKRKKNSHRKKIGEALESKDIEIIKKLIRDVISDVYRDIWIKRNSWK